MKPSKFCEAEAVISLKFVWASTLSCKAEYYQVKVSFCRAPHNRRSSNPSDYMMPYIKLIDMMAAKP
ncbi:hypothetical protein CGH62_26040 [Vibrio parahaemolyticus]|nr:hypothetical protein CGH62_26040 [Vibrio parahaemolyticus]